jgi:hypothetical protein
MLPAVPSSSPLLLVSIALTPFTPSPSFVFPVLSALEIATLGNDGTAIFSTPCGDVKLLIMAVL